MKSKPKCQLAVLFLAALGGCSLADGNPSALPKDQAEREINRVVEESLGRWVTPGHFLRMSPERRAQFSRDTRLRLLTMLTPEERAALTPGELASFTEEEVERESK